MKNIFELIKTFQFDISCDNVELKGRIELFQNLNDPGHFRFKSYESELFEMRPAFPQDENGTPVRATHEALWVERIFPGMDPGRLEFTADDENEAIEIIWKEIDSIHDFFEK